MNKEHIKNDFSHHVLSASATLLGLSFVVLTLPNDPLIKNVETIDKLASIAVFLFTLSTILSFLSLREIIYSKWAEMAADYIFIIGILILAATSLIIILDMF